MIRLYTNIDTQNMDPELKPNNFTYCGDEKENTYYI